MVRLCVCVQIWFFFRVELLTLVSGEAQGRIAKTYIMPVEGASPFFVWSLPAKLCAVPSIITHSSRQIAPFWISGLICSTFQLLLRCSCALFSVVCTQAARKPLVLYHKWAEKLKSSIPKYTFLSSTVHIMQLNWTCSLSYTLKVMWQKPSGLSCVCCLSSFPSSENLIWILNPWPAPGTQRNEKMDRECDIALHPCSF